jgi:3-dehydroquinate dehydratase-2
MHILIINGPNLNLLGSREPEIYGSQSFDVYLKELRSRFSGIQLEYFQSNHEGAIIDQLHHAGMRADGIVLNAGAYSHTSIAIADAIAAIQTPTIEVHISNVHARDDYRRHSYFSAHCVGSIIGLGLEGYALALAYFEKQVSRKI